ncbi:hypothetical protein IFO69_19685 [Echinicola sp. CAU 1574]|uniref:Uncharacterized protein n=1 Tax=Echinicola arenosa TaxID=2774144 RepID=A0ABR9ATQ3_9BACT|nr:DUF6528 family protein [Echinicola arenosa]MBD8490984.1 hypothetical protein [Echinicola arenosa]
MKFCCFQILVVLLYVSCSPSTANKSFLVCGDHKVLLVDYEQSTEDKPHVVWSWDAHQAQDLPAEYRDKKFNTMDDCKAIDGGQKILVSSSSGGVAMLDSETSEVLFYASVPNAHSVEILPYNRLVAAASTHSAGNKIMLFDIQNNDKPMFEDSLYSAHGLIWHKERNSLFALGYDVLREYTMPDPNSLVLQKEWKIPGEGGHDLQLTADGQDFLLTEHTGAWKFDLSSEEFSSLEEIPNTENIKSLGEHDSGQYMLTIPEKSWWTHHVTFYGPNKKIAFPDMKVYKARWFE